MCKRIIIILLLLLMVFILNAGRSELSAEEFQQRRVELQRMANRFKQETGFQGNIQLGHHSMTLNHFMGIFPDLTFPPASDTLAAKQVFEQIIERLLPVLPASREQLSLESIGGDERIIRAQYRQTVNGYEIEGSGTLRIAHEYELNRTVINNSLIYIDPTPVTPVITEEQAKEMFLQNVTISKYRTTGRSISIAFDLMYCHEREENSERPATPRRHRLAWRTVTLGHQFIVNAVTGEIMSNVDIASHSYTVMVTGVEYQGGYLASIINLSDVLVKASYSDTTLTEYTDLSGYAVFPNPYVMGIYSNLEGGKFEIIDSLGCSVYPSETTLPDTTYLHYGSNEAGHLFYYSNIYENWTTGFNNTTMPFIQVQFGLSQIDNDPRVMGMFLPNSGSYPLVQLHEYVGRYRIILLHELTHAFVYYTLDNNLFSSEPDENKKAMDEAFATYFPCAFRGNSRYYYSFTAELAARKDLEDPTIYVRHHIGSVLGEEDYSHYNNQVPIASAWWELRSHFTGTNFDQMLIDVLRDDINHNELDRYKPRYFFNALMRRVATDTTHVTINNDQQAIIDAYSARGLHFYPEVTTVKPDPDRGIRNIYEINDPIHVELSGFPQNTPFTIYVVENQEYTEGMPIPQNFLHSHTFITDNNGEWRDPDVDFTITDPGEYDVIVDVGNNGTVNFKFEGSNVVDGIKGLNEPGFVVIDRGIDVVYLSDISESSEVY